MDHGKTKRYFHATTLVLLPALFHQMEQQLHFMTIEMIFRKLYDLMVKLMLILSPVVG